MSDGGPKGFRHSREGGKTRPKAEVSRDGHPASFDAKTLGPRLRGDDEIVVIDYLKAL